MKRFKGVLAIVVCLSMIISLSFSTSAKVLAKFDGNSEWSFTPAPDPEGENQPTILTADGVTIASNVQMQYNLLVGEYDFSNGNPTELSITYSIATTQADLTASGEVNLYMVIGDDPTLSSRWWAGPYVIHSTNGEYEEQTWAFAPGGDLEWPTGVQKIWLHDSNVRTIDVKSLSILDDSAEPTAPASSESPSTSDSSSVFILLAVVLGSIALITISKRRAQLN
ncbi:MAG: hypothetical protein ACYC5K_01500 [Saccharofermentanales bacterium]